MTVYAFVLEQPWAMHQPTLHALVGVARRHAEGARLDPRDVDRIVAESAARNRTPPTGVEVRRGVGIVPIHGVIAPHASMVNGASQPRGTSVDVIRRNFRAALASQNVERVLLDIDSPGGTITGVPELAQEIYAARGRKPIIAFTAGMAASAAYWIGAQADRFVASMSAEIGSIGVYAVVADVHRRYELAGIDTHVVRTGPNKGAGVEGSKVTAGHLAVVQDRVETAFGWFKAALRSGRGLKGERLQAVSDGRIWHATAAQRLGLVDDVQTFDQLVAPRGAARRSPKPASVAPAPAITTMRSPPPATGHVLETSTMNSTTTTPEDRATVFANAALSAIHGDSTIAEKIVGMGVTQEAARALWTRSADVRKEFRSAEDVAFAIKLNTPGFEARIGSFLGRN